ncbi:hypothetical protein [Sphingobacterium hotanense]|uniref:Uncharacterized protein n=1 Tax=Sphingobacterium hotanense TaxID=649196 RepID=A0ABT7NQW6_9SPHI|nr:hypothetical protein [Sphingobacterium hotanense]MDM1049358.1 hypothetical protein [Sphingobacterium hotanense]
MPKQLLIMPIPISKLILPTFVVALLYSILKPIILDNIEEFCPWGSELGDILYQLSLAYVGGYIFYWIANFQSERFEHEKNNTINKVKIEKLIRSIQSTMILYLVYIGEKGKIKNPDDLLNIPIDNGSLKIGIRDENQQYKIIERVGDETVKRNSIYFNVFIEEATELNKSIDHCVNGYVLMPLDLIKIIENLNQRSHLKWLLKRLKGLDEYLSERGFPKEGLSIRGSENLDIRNEIMILRESVIELRKYYIKHFDIDFFGEFNIDEIIWLPQYNLLFPRNQEPNSL